MSERTLDDSLRWVDFGTALVAAELSKFDEADFAEPSALPGWSRKNLVAHIAANADAIGNLVHWAATGEPTPMYASPEARLATIEAGAEQSGTELTTWYQESAHTLSVAMAALTAEQWDHEVRTGQGRMVPASETPWMRSREVMVHAVDLNSGVTFNDLPADFLAALCDDIVGKRSGASGTEGAGPALVLSATDSDLSWDVAGTGDPVNVSGSLADLTSYLSGRGPAGVTAAGGNVPELPAWL